VIRVRRATSDDARAMATVHVRTWQAAYGHVFPREVLDALSIERRERGWREEFEAHGTTAFVAEADDRIVGFASVGPARDEAGVGELFTIYVEPESWGTGAGRALHAAAVAALAEAGYAEVILWVLVENPRARRFYEREGWRAEGSRRERFAGVEVDEVRYRRSL
jgi:RimJ/RimL family protein N-acetyltransferase